MTLPEITCRELAELVTEYLELALSEAERARFEDHLHACGACQRYVSQVRVTIRSVHAIPRPAITPDERGRLAELFERWRSAQPYDSSS